MAREVGAEGKAVAAALEESARLEGEARRAARGAGGRLFTHKAGGEGPGSPSRLHVQDRSRMVLRVKGPVRVGERWVSGV